ncbi:DUF3854 domain-containing protein [Paludibacter sp. 221]|uniref:CHC2 zinc finger domain-containing protein n=1 Tax=Paludibacter sp. 221 TaxID=2302939 RepID=UPI0013D23005|nr:CHC2 zinc finger domain-containing protein [Paludibacter sp. 221]NDV45820.1 DUF3854 domain-containing protein [Paludibacter sp. 221]
MVFSPENKDKILRASEGRLLDVAKDFISDMKKSGTSYLAKCPHCGSERGLSITPSKNLFKCFKCSHVKGSGALAFLMSAKEMEFVEALEYLTKRFSVIIDEPKTATPKKIKQGDSNGKKKSFCERMLKESGLTVKDLQASVILKDKNKTCLTSNVFKSGTIDKKFNIDANGDDVIIEYYDLDGKPVTYEKKDTYSKKVTTETFFRIRFQFPHEHLDKNGKPCKYKSPPGSSNNLYIPEAIRKLYREKTEVPLLFVQEGEKKAEKACKHGIWSVGISGINNLGKDGQLPADLIRIIESLKVKEIVLLFDADWNELSQEIKLNTSVAKRPLNFYYAARNFRDYIRTLKNREIYVETYIGHLNKVEINKRIDKGIDDLLANSLKGKENELKKDIKELINSKNLDGKYIHLYKITAWPDTKLEELWGLNNPQKFAQMHKDVLSGMPEFRIGRHTWRFKENGEIESAQPIDPDEQYWEEVTRTDRSGKERTSYEFNYVHCFRFLRNRGFGRYRMLDNTDVFIHTSQHEVRQVTHTEIRDFVSEFTTMVANEDVLNMLYRGGPQYMGPDKLSNLQYIEPNFEKPVRDMQRFYFKNTCWEINADGIKEVDYSQVTYQIWSDQKQDSQPTLYQYPLITIQCSDDGVFSYKLSSTAEKAHFLQFLINTSNFNWRKKQNNNQEEINPEELAKEEEENVQHLVAKLSAIGYMLMTCKDRSVAKAVIAMDGKQSEVGQSNGRSGKSIIGEMLKQILPTAFINGKSKNIEDDNFLWDPITEKTKIVFIDDVRTNFNIEFLFPNITGDWNVNYKGGRRAIIPFQQSPKIYIPTNHALNGKGSSFTDRMWIIAFSDFYNDNHKPVDDFGQLFFDEWDFDQWNYLWNLLAVCVQTYLRFGVVEAPAERIELRNLRQQMGESFLLWAEEYFSDEAKLNTQLKRRELYEEFIVQFPEQRKFISATSFKERIKAYCKWKGYIFNKSRFDPISGEPLYYDKKSGDAIIDYKTGGIEYFEIGTPDEEPEQEKQFEF